MPFYYGNGTTLAGQQTISTASTMTNDAVWVNWNTTASTTVTMHVTQTVSGTTWEVWNTAWVETQEQREARERAAAAAERRSQEAQRECAAAKARALELLGMVLTPAQMASYQEKGWFEVTSSKGRRWRIRNRGQSGNVDLMPEIGDEREASYCAHPPGGLPDPDAHLAQALVLVTDEDEFLRVANRHYQRAAHARAA